MSHYRNENWDIYYFDEGQTVPKGLTPVTEEEMADHERVKAKAAFDALPYDQKRAAEYPPMAEYIDGVVKGDDAQVQAYIDACLAVKSKYPKA